MKYNGENLEEVIQEHYKFLESGGAYEEGRADFTDANLTGLYAPNTDFTGAIFRGANLSSSCLYKANFTCADLTGANLYEADLFKAEMFGVIGMPYIPMRIPDTGSFIAWKQARLLTGANHYEDGVIIKLRIPDDAERICMFNGECRASKAEVLEIQTIEGEALEHTIAFSIKDCKTVYCPGEIVGVEHFNPDRSRIHAQGIFFYLERQQAVDYLSGGRDKHGNLIPISREQATEAVDYLNKYPDSWEFTDDILHERLQPAECELHNTYKVP